MRTIYFNIFMSLALVAGALAESPGVAASDTAQAPATSAPVPQRIVSASLASDEILLTLLQQDRQRLLAVSELVDDPRYSNVGQLVDDKLKRFGGNLEALIKLQPGLVILAPFNRPEYRQRLKEARIPIYDLPQVSDLDGIAASIGQLGKIVAKEKEAQQLKSRFTRAKQHLNAHPAPPQQSRRPTVLRVYSRGQVDGSGTIFDDMCRWVGAENLAAARGLKGWQSLSAEVAAGLSPDWIVLSAPDPASKLADIPAWRDLQTMAGWQAIPAVKNRRVIVLSSAAATALSHYVLSAVAQLHRGLGGKIWPVGIVPRQPGQP